LKVLENECEREIRLVEDLLELQQLEMLKGLRPANANGSQRLCWLELQEWLPQIAEPFAQEAHSRHQRFSLGIPSETACHFYPAGSAKVGAGGIAEKRL
jgi:signal transduction histidine kinase